MPAPSRRVPVLTLLFLATPVLATAQETFTCDDGGWHDDRRARACEIRELTLDARDLLRVDGGRNGGVRVEAWDGSEIRVLARVQASGRDEGQAAEVLRAIEIHSDGTLRAEGPSMRERDRSSDGSWAVSYQIRVPRSTDLDIETRNGGIAIAGVDGRITFDAMNGGIALTDVAGDVRGGTTNGGVRVRLGGDRWEGAGLEVRTTNGGVTLEVPEGYSARLETGTVNGGMRTDFPLTVQGRVGRRLEAVLGDGGPLVRVTTTNGGVRLARR